MLRNILLLCKNIFRVVFLASGGFTQTPISVNMTLSLEKTAADP